MVRGISMLTRRLLTTKGTPIIYFYDTFTDNDGVTLTDHLQNIDINVAGNSWTNAPPSASAIYTISNNTAVIDSAELIKRLIVDVEQSDIIITCDIDPSANSHGDGIIFRTAPGFGGTASNGWVVSWQRSNLLWSIYEWVSDTLILRASAFVAGTNGDPHSVEITCNGNSISAKLNGDNEITYTSANFATNTNVGLFRLNRTGVTSWDNFKVTSL